MRITTRQKFSIWFSLYFIAFFILLSALFIVIFRYMYFRQIQREVGLEFSEIVKEYVQIDKQGLFFKRDSKGETLRSHLFADSMSALFVASDSSLLRAYGTFEVGLTKENLMPVISSLQVSLQNMKVVETTIVWRNQAYYALVTPIKYQSKPVASMVIAKSLHDLEDSTSTMIGIMLVLGALGVAGSVLVGYGASIRLLSPVHALIGAINKTSLHDIVPVDTLNGPRNDEFVQLIKTYNDMVIRLKTMASRQREFVANASHELKTPLARAVSSLDLLDVASPHFVSDVSHIKHDLLDINTLLERLLVLSKIRERGPIHEKTLLSTVLLTIQNYFSTRLTEKNISFVTHGIGNITIPLPKEYAVIVLQNIVGNAIKYSPHSTTITFSSEVNNGIITISVSDQGQGMNYLDKLRMFDRFFRGSKTRTGTEGYGVGMALVKEICDEYGATIEVLSAENKGTKITLTFLL